MAIRRRLGLTLLVCLLAASLVACGPKTATIKITVKDTDSKPLAGITVTAGGKSGTTDASGVATLKDVPPGQVEVKLSGEGYDHQQNETVKAGDNAFSYSVTPGIGALRSIGELNTMRLRAKVVHPGTDWPAEDVEAAFVRGQASSWKLTGIEIRVIGTTLYIKDGSSPWEKFEGQIGEMMASSYLAMGEVYLSTYSDFAESVGGSALGADYQTKYLGRETVNGYDCRVYETVITFQGQRMSHKSWVIAGGAFAGYMTRYELDVQGEYQSTIDVYDLNQPFEIQKPI